MIPASIDIKPRHLTLLFASLSLCIFFLGETYSVISAIRKENAIEAQSHRLGPNIVKRQKSREFMTRGVKENNVKVLTQNGENRNIKLRAHDGDKRSAELLVHGGEASRGEVIARDVEKSSGEMMTTGVEESSAQSMVQNVNNGYPSRNAETVVHNEEASRGEIIAQDRENSRGVLITTGVVESRLNGYPYNVLRNINEPVNLKEDGDIPLFWHIHKSGGSSMKHIFTCLRKVQTRRMNDPEICTDQEPTLRICKLEFGSVNLGSRVINTDLSSLGGIQRAVDLELTKAGKFRSPPDCTVNHEGGCTEQEFIVDTSRIYDALQIFTHTRKARLFILFRHPVERAISKYFYIKVATWERNYKPQVANMTLFDYADSKLCYNNWVTRRLVNKMEGDLTHADLQVAKEILRRKTLVLLLEDIDGAVKRLRNFFGWDTELLDQEQQFCLKEHMHSNPINVNKNKDYVEPGGPEWDAVKKKNLIDLELYYYAKELYQLQEQEIIQSYAVKSNL